MLVSIHIHKWMLATLLVAGLLQTAGAQVMSLQACLDSAQAYNRNVRIGENAVRISEQRYQEARGLVKPKANLNADYRYYTNLPYQLMPMSVFGGPEGQFKEAQFGVPHNINANVQVSVPLYNAQANGAIRTAKIALEVSRLQKAKTVEQIYFEVSNTYYNAQILQHQLNFIHSNLENANKLLVTMRMLKDQLLARGSDVSKVALQVQQLTTKSLIVKSQYEGALDALKFLMGIPMERHIEVEATIGYHDDEEYADQSTTDIRLAVAQLRLISSEVAATKGAKIPAVSLFGAFGATGFGYDVSPNGFLKFYPLGFAGIQFTFPLFNGTVTDRKIRQKNLELSNAELQLELLTDKNKLEIENARRQKLVSQSTLQTTRSEVDLARSIYEQTVLQQKQGTATLTDVLVADNSLAQAQQNYLDSVVAFLKATLELKRLTGNILNK
ncbi:MAG TPA: TolC family protein [Chryseosolibacter sp.]